MGLSRVWVHTRLLNNPWLRSHYLPRPLGTPPDVLFNLSPPPVETLHGLTMVCIGHVGYYRGEDLLEEVADSFIRDLLWVLRVDKWWIVEMLRRVV